jgi:apolipoprotein N-acyltransferase
VDVVLAGASGLFLVLCFPKVDLSILAWVALVPLLVALDGKRAGRAYVLAYATGLPFFAGLFAWIWMVPAWNLLDSVLVQGLYLPQYIALWGLGLGWIRRRTGASPALVAPALWVVSEYGRAHAGFLSLPWMFLGHSQHAHPLLTQVSALTGTYGLSFLVVLTNVGIAEAIMRVSRRRPAGVAWRCVPRSALVPAGVAAALVAATLAYGVVVLSQASGPEPLRVAVIQGNVPIRPGNPRAVVDRNAALTLEAARDGPALIVWPESSVPGDVEHHAPLRRAVSQLAVDTGAHLLVGSNESAKFSDKQLQGKVYNSLVLFSPAGVIEGVYRKQRLVPFGEYVPLERYVAWPAALVGARGNSMPGEARAALAAGPVTFRAIICWEIIFPDYVREVVGRGAQFLVLATNEAWFGDTAAPHQLLAMTALRAAENRIAIVRAANSGVSALIDPFGRISRRLVNGEGRDVFVEGTLGGEIPLVEGTTFYTRYGDLFAFFMIGLVGVLVVRTWRPSWIRQRMQVAIEA